MRLLLHAGTHKSGTTTLQRAFYESRADLLAHGIAYPDAQRWFGGTSTGHHPWAHAVAGSDDDLNSAREMLAHLREAPYETVLLSAEPVYRHTLSDVGGGWWRRHHAYLLRLAEELASFEVEVVLVFRRRDEFLESMYAEKVAHGFGKPFDHVIRNSDRFLNYQRQVHAFRDTFPTVRTIDYATVAGANLANDFLRAVGIDGVDVATPARERRSVDARLTLWMAVAYREDPDPELVTQRRRFSKNPVSNELFDDYGRVTLWDDPAARRELLDRYGDHEPIEDSRAPALLTPDVEDRIDRAFDEYLVAKGLRPAGRRARRHP